jgi:crossover junction endodeoxyribonuclease RuvC
MMLLIRHNVCFIQFKHIIYGKRKVYEEYNNFMRILGIDPGIGRTGWGVLDVQGPTYSVQGFGCIETTKDELVESRLETLYNELLRLLTTYKPDALAIEELFFNTNVSTALVVGQARGIVFLASKQNNVPIAVYTPLQIKLAVTGYGRADKKQVGQMIKTILHLSEIPKPDDTADALAIALTHASSYKIKKK